LGISQEFSPDSRAAQNGYSRSRWCQGI